MNLHGRIMNIRAVVPARLGVEGDKYRAFERAAYLDGHKAARHAAAEIAAEADAELETLRKRIAELELDIELRDGDDREEY